MVRVRVGIREPGVVTVQFQFQSISIVFVHMEICVILLLPTKFQFGSACNKEVSGSYGPF